MFTLLIFYISAVLIILAAGLENIQLLYMALPLYIYCLWRFTTYE
uniref:Uncharacterized protein n=1 Tax=Siphoviridae sp. ctX581 TaxID=2826365 RepID=A0A8S5MDH0_9CAUD|nr:MAG TPA: hypothetical protein [Siphoviridae sp. ctX581]